jgi:putative ABC transport system permease protein
MSTLWQDVRFALRTLLKNPGFTLIAVLTLTLGIGANSAIFSVVNAVLVRPLPYPEPERLMFLRETSLQGESSVSYPNFVDWKAESRVFESMAASRADSFNLTRSGEPERLPGRMVSAGWLETLGIRPALGRPIAPQEDAKGASPVVMISHALWQRQFAADPQIIRKAIWLNGMSHTVIAVLPDGLEHYSFAPVDVYVPIATELQTWERDNHPGISVLARLRHGATLAEARAEMATIAAAMEKQYPDTNRGRGVKIIPLRENVLGDVQPALVILLAAVGVVLLVACADLSNLLLARGAARQKEITIRQALGAGRARLVRQLLTESLLLSLAGGVLGLALTGWLVEAVRAFPPANIPRIEQARVDRVVIAFTLILSVLTGVIFGLVPALRASAVNLVATLKGASGHATGTRGHQRLRQGLIVSEFALTLALLVSAALLLESFARMSGTNPGYDAHGLLSMVISLPAADYQGRRPLDFYEELRRRMASLPQATAAAYTNDLPFFSDDEESFYAEGMPVPKAGEYPLALEYIVSPGYFQAMKIPIVAGRAFTAADTAGTPLRLVVDENLAQKFFGGDALGKHLKFPGDDSPPPMDIIGVARHVLPFSLTGEEAAPYQMYFAYPQIPEKYLYRAGSMMGLLVRTDGDPRALAPALRTQVQRLDPNLPVYSVESMEARMAESIAPQRFSALLISSFATLAVLLAAAGLFGVISYSVSQRTQEIGIRMTLGAERRSVMRLVVGEGLKLALAGVGVGLAGSLVFTRLLASQLHGVGPTDPATFAGVVVLLTAVAVLACYLPARRAMRVDPLVALRYE